MTDKEIEKHIDTEVKKLKDEKIIEYYISEITYYTVNDIDGDIIYQTKNESKAHKFLETLQNLKKP